MSKKILSLLLAVVMVALSVSTLIVPSFAAEEAEDPVKPTANTGFNLHENFVLEGDSHTWLEDKSTPPKVTNNGAWQAGLLNLTFDESKVAEDGWKTCLEIGDTFQPFDTVKGHSYAYNSVAVEWSANNGGGRRSLTLFLEDKNLKNDWAIYLTTGLNYDWGSSSPSAQIVGYTHTPALRYVAQFSGNLTVTLDGGWFSADASGYQHLLVRHNDKVLEDIVNADAADVIKTYTFDVKKGDVIDFISFIDPILSYEHSDKDDAAAEIWANATNEEGITDPINFRRGFRIDDIDIEYNTFTSDSKWDSSVLSNANVLPYNNTNVLFFRTYGGVVKVNTDLYELCGITAETPLTEAYDKFCAYLKKNSRITVNSSEWSYGNVVTTTAYYSTACQFQSYDPFMYYAYYYNKNLLTTAASGNGFYATEADWDKMMATIMSDLLVSGLLKAGEVTVDATNASAVKVGELVASSNNASLPIYYGLDWKNFTNPPSIGKISGEIRSGENKLGNAGFCYTAPAAGKLTITMDSMTMLDQNGSPVKANGYQWNLAVNGVFTYTGGNWQATDFTEVTVDVEAGDEVIVVIFRYLATNFEPTFTASLTSDLSSLTFDTNASLVIDDAYSVKMTATPSAADGVITALVDGEWVEGTLEDGKYVFMLKEGIKVSDLTATAAGENREGVTVSYRLKEVVNGHTLTSSVYSTTTDKMLSYYEASTDTKVATLAKDIRHLAIAANAALKGIALTQDEKDYISKANEDLSKLNVEYGYKNSEEEFDYVIAAANVNLGDKISLVFLVQANDGADLNALREGYVLRAYEDTEKVAEAPEFKSVFLGNTEYLGVIVDVPVAKYNSTDLTFVVENAEGTPVSAALQYSVSAWIANKYTNSESVNDYLIRAVYNLGVSAAAYETANAAN